MSNAQVADKLETPTLMSLQELERAETGTASGGSQAREGHAKNASELAPKRQRPAPNGYSLPVGRPKGVQNKVTRSIREAIEIAANDCHPQGFAGWLVERAQGGVEDRKIFAGVIGRVVPLQVQQKSEGVVRIELGWLNGRDVGRHLSQPLPIAAQVVDIKDESAAVPMIKHQSDTAEGVAGEGADGQAAQDGAGDAQGG